MNNNQVNRCTIVTKKRHGFRRKRSTADAIDALHRWLSRSCSPEWILEGDIKGCFDNISHEWLVSNVRTDKVILTKWLKSGVIFNKQFQPTTVGTPPKKKGGIISPTLANATLDGMVKLLEERYAPTYVDGKLYYPNAAKTPVKLCHSRTDDFVPYSNAVAAKEKWSNVTLIDLTSTGHIQAGMEFLLRYMGLWGMMTPNQ